MRRLMAAVALGLVVSTSPYRAFAEKLDIQAELSRPQTKLLVVEFFATWCKPCMKAVPRWEALRKEYAQKGLRFVVVAVKDDRKRCTDVPWVPDRIICDTEGDIAEKFGAMHLPAAFLWNWQGHLLASKVHVAEVERQIELWMNSIPRVKVEVNLETTQAGVERTALERLIASELSAAGKLVVVASEREKKRLRKLARESLSLHADEHQQCDLGKEVSANSLLQATLTRGAEQLRLGLLSVESHCRTRDVYAPWSPERPSRGVSTAVAKLLTSLQRPELQLPLSLGAPARRSTRPPAPVTDYEAILAQAEEAEKKARIAREVADKLRAARQAELNNAWKAVSKAATTSALDSAIRINALTQFLTDFPEDNVHRQKAENYLTMLRSGNDPARLKDDLCRDAPSSEPCRKQKACDGGSARWVL